jgi:hypothetical protein
MESLKWNFDTFVTIHRITLEVGLLAIEYEPSNG